MASSTQLVHSFGKKEVGLGPENLGFAGDSLGREFFDGNLLEGLAEE